MAFEGIVKSEFAFDFGKGEFCNPNPTSHMIPTPAHSQRITNSIHLFPITHFL